MRNGMPLSAHGLQDEESWELDSLSRRLDRLKGQRIGVYGSDSAARRIIESGVLGDRFVVVADDGHVGESVAGYEAVSLASALKGGVEALIVAAADRSAWVMCQHVRPACKLAGVRVYDACGNDVEELGQLVTKAREETIAQQLEWICAADVVCVSVNVLRDGPLDRSVGACLSSGERIRACLDEVLAAELAHGRELVLVSDDPELGAQEARTIAEAHGLSGCTLLLRKELGLSVSGGLYRALVAARPGATVCMIGQSLFRDCVVPLSLGWDVVFVGGRSREAWFQNSLYELHPLAKGHWYKTMGAVLDDTAEARLRDAFVDCMPRLERSYGEPVAHVASVLAPIALGFVQWLVTGVRQRACDAVLFAARDGKLLMRVYRLLAERDALGELPAAHYLYTSRLSADGAAHDAASGHPQRTGLYTYLTSLGLPIGGSCAFVDCVATGICQQDLAQVAPFDLHGYYLGSRSGRGELVPRDVRTFFMEEDVGFLYRYLTFEPYFSSLEPSLCSYGANGSLSFSPEVRQPGELELLRQIHEATVDACKAYLDGFYLPGDALDHGFISWVATNIDECEATQLTLYDDLGEDRSFEHPFTGELVTLKGAHTRAAQLVGGGVEPAESLTDDGNGAQGEVAEPGSHDADIVEERPLRTVHDVLLDLLKTFDAFCSAHNLRYVATHGTLLGAVRHQGFIPWDDDLDVAMPRADYDQLVKLASLGALPKPYFLQTPENDPECFFGGFAKLRDSSTSAIDPTVQGHSFNQGIWMDIMPLDDCPRSERAVEQRQRLVRTWQRVLYFKTYGMDMRRLWDVDPKKLSLYAVLAERSSRRGLCKRLYKACTGARHTGLLTVFAGNYRYTKNCVRYNEEDVVAAERVAFEDTTIPVMRNAHRWLAERYGRSWQEVRPEKHQESGHERLFDPNTPYEELLAKEDCNAQ